MINNLTYLNLTSELSVYVDCLLHT